MSTTIAGETGKRVPSLRAIAVVLLLIVALGAGLWMVRGRLAARYARFVGERERERAEKALAANELNAAWMHIDQALRRQPTEPGNWRVAADVLRNSGQPGQAFFLARAMELEPANSDVAVRFVEAATVESARYLLDREIVGIMKRHGTNAAVVQAVAQCQMTLGQVASAHQLFRIARGLNPTNLALAVTVASLDASLTDPVVSAAGRSRLEELAADPGVGTDVKWRLALASAKVDPARACAWAEEVLKAQPGHSNAALFVVGMKHATDPAGTAARMNALWSGATNLAMRLRVVDLEAGLLGPAAGLSRLELLPEPDRGQSDAVIAHAAMLARMSNWSGMVAFLDSALPQAAKDPGALADLETESRLAKATGGTNEFVHPLADQAMVLAWKVCAQRNAGDVEGGRATTRLLAAAVERRPVLALAAARQLYLWGMYDAAADAVRFAVERRTPGRFYLLDLACSASAAANRMDDAIQYAEAMVAMNPRDYAARSNLALYLLESGSDLKRGLTLAAEVRQANLDNPFFHDLYALALALNGRADEALREHGKMQADVLSNPRMRFTRARILALQGRVDDARKMAEPIQPEMVLVYQRTALRRLQEPGAVPARAK